MNNLKLDIDAARDHAAPSLKFTDPDRTADGSKRAQVPLTRLETLWVNTGTLCNIECAHCYIFSSPTNDDLVYFSHKELVPFLDEIETLGLGTREIGFTGGEPFMNPDMIAMAEEALRRGFEVLILTNAMQPMMRPKVQDGLLGLQARFGDKLTMRISLDHYSAERHDEERGSGAFAKSMNGLDWLDKNGFRISIAGRSLWGEDEDKARAEFASLFTARGWSINADDQEALVIFPEMDEQADVPEITSDCWGILGLDPSEIMCASSRMIVKRRGEDEPKILPCTLIAFRDDFEMGTTLASSLKVDGGMFDDGAVKLCHVHCAKFCVLGGGSCSG